MIDIYSLTGSGRKIISIFMVFSLEKSIALIIIIVVVVLPGTGKTIGTHHIPSSGVFILLPIDSALRPLSKVVSRCVYDDCKIEQIVQEL